MKTHLSTHRYLVALLAAVIVALPLSVYAQEESVKPGINKSFEDPDVERYIKMFEGDGRAIYSNRNKIVEVLELEPGDDVGDIGAGTGFFSFLFAEKVGSAGTVYSVDIAQNFLNHIKETATKRELTNLKTQLATPRSVELKENSIDVAFICDVYHHFEYPNDSMASLHKALRPDGLLVIVDFERIKGVTTDFSLSHIRAGKGTFTDEIKDSGFDFIREVEMMEEQYVITFRKREAKTDDE